MKVYKSQFAPSQLALKVMASGRVIAADETPELVVERITDALFEQELKFSPTAEAKEFAEAFGRALDDKEIVMSTPVMTNAGRYTDRPLTACIMPTSGIDSLRSKKLREEIITLHEQGMGTGFNLDDTEYPVSALEFLNELAVDSAGSGREDRPVGNMAILGVRHPEIHKFINAKVGSPSEWKFNISVDIDQEFMDAVETGSVVDLDNGHPVEARRLFDEICRAASLCADPGIVFLDRMNARNPLPGMGTYKTTAPCAEVGLIPGETCQFGYINIGKFVYVNDYGRAAVNLPWLEHTMAVPATHRRRCAVRAELLGKLVAASGDDCPKAFRAEMIEKINWVAAYSVIRYTGKLRLIVWIGWSASMIFLALCATAVTIQQAGPEPMPFSVCA